MIICVRIFIPPFAGIEFTESDKVNATTAFGEEFASPFGKHFIFIKADLTLGRIENVVKILGRIIAFTHRVEQFCSSVAVARAHFTFRKRINDLGKTDFGVIAFKLVGVIVIIERIFYEVPS